MRKKLLSLALVLVLSLMPSAFAAENGVSRFTDIPANAWYTEELEYAVSNGYISGTSDTTFSPDGLVTRSQFVTILGRMMNVDTSLYTSSKFDDVDPNSWYGPYVSWASEMGYVNGYSPSEFGPGNSITVEQMGVIISNYISKSGVVLTPSSTFSGYADEASISRWAQTSMEVMAKYDLLPVNEAGNVRPTSPVIRSEAAVALVRLAKGDGKGGKPISNGTSEVIEQKPTADSNAFVKEKAQQVHDMLWSSGVITSSSTERERAVAYFDWMVHSGIRYGFGTAYGTDKRDAYTAYGVFQNGYGVCEGLCEAYMALLDAEGIKNEPAIYLADSVMASGGYGHMNVAVFCDGVRYEINVTRIPDGRNPDGSPNANSLEVLHLMFMTEEEIAAWKASQGIYSIDD